jgi:hypothetical protein
MSAEKPPTPNGTLERLSYVPKDVETIEWDQVPVRPEVSPFDEAIEQLQAQQIQKQTQEQIQKQTPEDKHAIEKVIESLARNVEADPGKHEKDIHKKPEINKKKSASKSHEAGHGHEKHEKGHAHHGHKPISKKDQAIANLIFGTGLVLAGGVAESTLAPALVGWLGLSPLVSGSLALVGLGAAWTGVFSMVGLSFGYNLLAALWDEGKKELGKMNLGGLSLGSGGGSKKRSSGGGGGHAPSGGGGH